MRKGVKKVLVFLICVYFLCMCVWVCVCVGMYVSVYECLYKLFHCKEIVISLKVHLAFYTVNPPPPLFRPPAQLGGFKGAGWGLMVIPSCLYV